MPLRRPQETLGGFHKRYEDRVRVHIPFLSLHGCGCWGKSKWMGAMVRWQRDSCLMTLVAFARHIVADRPALVSSRERGCVICGAPRDILISWNLWDSVDSAIHSQSCYLHMFTAAATLVLWRNTTSHLCCCFLKLSGQGTSAAVVKLWRVF